MLVSSIRAFPRTDGHGARTSMLACFVEKSVPKENIHKRSHRQTFKSVPTDRHTQAFPQTCTSVPTDGQTMGLELAFEHFLR